MTTGPVTGRIHSWDLSTGVDGPGTRFVLFVSGRCLAEIDKYRPFLAAAGGG